MYKYFYCLKHKIKHAKGKVPTTVGSMARKLWHSLPGQHWPMLPSQEKQFYETLLEYKTKTSKFNRDDVTLLMSILRCGSSVDQVREQVPGVKFHRILNSYRYLKDSLEEALSAWGEIENNPSLEILHSNASNAAMILPIPIHYALSSQGQLTETAVIDSIAYSSGKIGSIGVNVHALEKKLEKLPSGSPEGVAIGKKLFDPYSPGLYANPYYKPDRVSSLTPLRVKDLISRLKNIN